MMAFAACSGWFSRTERTANSGAAELRQKYAYGAELPTGDQVAVTFAPMGTPAILAN
jgi:hypothetical protein